MTITTWPAALKARRWNANLRNQAATGPRSPTGRAQQVLGDAGFWQIDVGPIPIRNREQAAAYRALIARLRAGEDILLPVCDLYLPTGARVNGAGGALTATGGLRETEISLRASVDIKPGHYLTIGDRLHLVTEILKGPVDPWAPVALSQIATDSPWSDDVPWRDEVVDRGAAYVARILPPLRRLYGATTAITFDELKLRCVLRTLDEGDLDLDLGRFGTPTLSFHESI